MEKNYADVSFTLYFLIDQINKRKIIISGSG